MRSRQFCRQRTDSTTHLESVTNQRATDGDCHTWAALAARRGNLFATPEWIELWSHHFGPPGDPPVELVHDNGRLVAVLPLYLWRTHPARVARFLGHGAGDELGPLCLAEDESAAAAAVEHWLSEAAADVLFAEHLPADRPWAPLLHGTRVSADGSPRVRFGGRDWDDYLATRSRDFRSMVRRAEKKALALPGARWRLADDPERLGADLDSLFALHRLRWDGARTNFATREAFHRAFAAVALSQGWLRFWLLESAGRPIAAWYGFRFAGNELYYQAGRDPSFRQASVGLALIAHSMREAQRDGVGEYRFLRGGEEFKYRFADDDPGVQTLAAARTLRGTAAIAAARVFRSARRLASRR